MGYTQTTGGGSLVHKVMTYMSFGGFMTFSGLTLVVRLKFSTEIHEFHEIPVTFFFLFSFLAPTVNSFVYSQSFSTSLLL